MGKILPELCSHLKVKKMDTLKDYTVPWTNNTLTTQIYHHIIGKMCLNAATGVELQCKREYWEIQNNEVILSEPQATRINLLSPDERKHLPTNNLSIERYLAKFGYLASQ